MSLSFSVFFIFFLSLAIPLLSQDLPAEPILLEKTHPVQMIGNQTFYYIDIHADLNPGNYSGKINDLKKKFKRNHTDIFTRKPSQSVYWFYFKIQNLTNEKSYIQFLSSFWWFLEFYEIEGDTIRKLGESGALIENTMNPIQSGMFWFPLIEDNKEHEYLIRGYTPRPIEFPIQLGTYTGLLLRENITNKIMFFYLGISLIMFFYNISLYLIIRDKAYLYYILFLFFATLAILQSNHMHFWKGLIPFPLERYFNEHALTIASFSLIVIGLFALNILNFSKNPKMKTVVHSILLLYLLVIPCMDLTGILPLDIITRIFQPLSIVYFLTLLVFSFYFWIFRKDKAARFFFLGWIWIFSGLLVYFLLVNGVLPMNYYTQYSLIIGSSMEIFLFSLALGDKINQLKENLLGIQQKNIDLITQQNIGLEEKVNEKTKRLEANHQKRKFILKELRKAKINSELANKAKSEFLTKMSHEIRTPLNGVLGFTELLRHTELDEVQDQYLQNISGSAESLLGIINDILDLSKIEAGKLEMDPVQISLMDLMEKVVDFISPVVYRKEIELILNVSSTTPDLILADPLRVRQILLNLLSNAVKFTESGQIEVKVNSKEISSGEVEINFAVSDTGIGISPENQKKLFQSFSQADNTITRRYGGTGLGLVISKHLCQKMGSDLSMKSELGLGTEFSFSLKTNFFLSKNKKFETKIQKAILVSGHSGLIGIMRSLLSGYSINLDVKNPKEFQLNSLSSDSFDICFWDLGFARESSFLSAYNYIDIKLIKKTIFLSSIHLKLPTERTNFKFLIKPVKRSNLEQVLGIATSAKQEFRSNSGSSPRTQSRIEKELRFLIIEDVRLNADLLKGMIKKLIPKYTIDFAINGNIGLEKMAEKNYDLVFMDVHMPEMDGITATEIQRNKEKMGGERQLIIALTAGALKEEKEKCLNVGMDDFLTKPVGMNDLKSLFEKYFSSEK